MQMMTPMKKKTMPPTSRMTPMPKGIDPLPQEQGNTDSTVNDAFQGGGQIVLNVSDYPKLEGIEAGAPVTGQWEGTVDSPADKDGNVPVTFTKMEVETENSADKALQDLSNKPAEESGNDAQDDEL